MMLGAVPKPPGGHEPSVPPAPRRAPPCEMRTRARLRYHAQYLSPSLGHSLTRPLTHSLTHSHPRSPIPTLLSLLLRAQLQPSLPRGRPQQHDEREGPGINKQLPFSVAVGRSCSRFRFMTGMFVHSPASHLHLLRVMHSFFSQLEYLHSEKECRMDHEPEQLNMLGGINAFQCGLAATSGHSTRLATAAPGDSPPPWSRELPNR